jgi:hypothetical protein
LCLVFDSSPRSQSSADMYSFLIVAWASDPDFIPTEVGFSISEPIEPFREGVPPLFLRASEIVHSKCDPLHYRTIISILEVHDFNTPPSSDFDNGDNYGLGGSSDNDEYAGYNPCRDFLDSWLVTRRLVSGVGSSGDPWPSLPIVGGGGGVLGISRRHNGRVSPIYVSLPGGASRAALRSRAQQWVTAGFWGAGGQQPCGVMWGSEQPANGRSTTVW